QFVFFKIEIFKISKMFESDISVNSVSKTTMESSGFVTPRNNGALAGKALFTDRAKVALGNTKNNMRHLQTPSNDIELLEHSTAMLSPTHSDCPKRDVDEEHTDEIVMMQSAHLSSPSGDWYKNLMLDSDTYNLIFIDGPNVDLYPPEPESEPYLDATWDFKADNEYDEYELPEVKLSL
ncbi:hypothetical protein Bhyg_15832, partial [Pseudolycoriella hygida]